MTQEIAERPQQNVTVWTREQIELVKRTVAKGATDDELKLFMHVAQKTGLDPFSRQIYAIKRWDSREKKEVLQPQTSIDGYRLIAERTDRYMPGKSPTYSHKEDGSLESSTAYIKKMDSKGNWHEISAEAFWDEYVVTYERDGKKKLGPMWEKMPRVMLAKCAESLAIRRAFPAETSGIYTIEEMGRANAEQKPSPAMPESTEAEETVDPETGEITEPAPTGTRLSVKQQAYLFGLAKKKGWNEGDVKAYCTKFYAKPDPTTLTSVELNKVLGILKGMPDASPAE